MMDRLSFVRVRVFAQARRSQEDEESPLLLSLWIHVESVQAAGGPTRVENAKVGLIQFCLSAPKTDMENNVVVSDYAAMDRLLRDAARVSLKSVSEECLVSAGVPSATVETGL